MTTTELLASIDDLRSELAEARRYVRTQPSEAGALLARCHDLLFEIYSASDDSDFGGSGIEAITDRLMDNLRAGRKARCASPNILEGYIDGALWEMAWIKGQVEKSPATAGEGGGAR